MLADTIKDIRRRNYMNQSQFANKIGVTQGTISQWENNLTRPNSEQLRSISSAFNISIDDLLRGENTTEPAPGVPKTKEARLLAKGVDTMPEDQRKAFLNFVISMRPDVFKNGTDEYDT